MALGMPGQATRERLLSWCSVNQRWLLERRITPPSEDAALASAANTFVFFIYHLLCAEIDSVYIYKSLA